MVERLTSYILRPTLFPFLHSLWLKLWRVTAAVGCRLRPPCGSSPFFSLTSWKGERQVTKLCGILLGTGAEEEMVGTVFLGTGTQHLLYFHSSQWQDSAPGIAEE